jgi:hypothetical protein
MPQKDKTLKKIKEPTSPYPDSDKSEWVREYLVPPVLDASGLWVYEYQVHSSASSKAKGDLPFLFNSHKSMIRTNHQRNIKLPSGALLHESGAEVMPLDVLDFLENDPAAHHWISKSPTEWENDKGVKVPPFLFANYWGVVEALDPQWQHETYTITHASQLADILDRYDVSVMARKLSGDHRGTTLDLQVGAALDDSRSIDATYTNTSIYATYGGVELNGFHEGQVRFTNVTVPQGSTIDTCDAIFNPNGSRSGTTCIIELALEDADNPGQVTSESDFNARVLTTARVADSGVAAWTDAVEYTSPELKTTLQEVVDRGGFASGNAINLFSKDNGSTNGAFRHGHSYDSDTAKAVKFHIEYTVAGGSLLLTHPNQRNVLLRR